MKFAKINTNKSVLILIAFLFAVFKEVSLVCLHYFSHNNLLLLAAPQHYMLSFNLCLFLILVLSSSAKICSFP